MFVEFDSKLINSEYFGKVEKLDIQVGGTTTYALRYEIINGAVYTKEFDSETARNAEYDSLKS